MCILLSTVRDLIALWPSRKVFVDDLLEQGFAMSLARVHKWAQLGAIPAKYHQGILMAARGRDLPVSADVLVQLHHSPDHKAYGVVFQRNLDPEIHHVPTPQNT